MHDFVSHRKYLDPHPVNYVQLLLYDIVNVTLRFSQQSVLATIRCVLVPIGFECVTARLPFFAPVSHMDPIVHAKKKNEPPHVKTNKMACAPSKDSDQPEGIRPV